MLAEGSEEKIKDSETAADMAVGVDEILNVLNVEAQAIGKYKLLARF